MSFAGWEHGVRTNHILRLDLTDSGWIATLMVGTTFAITKDGRRLFMDGPILFCDHLWRMRGFVLVTYQNIIQLTSTSAQTKVTAKVIHLFEPETSEIFSREMAAAQRAAGNEGATWPPA